MEGGGDEGGEEMGMGMGMGIGGGGGAGRYLKNSMMGGKC